MDSRNNEVNRIVAELRYKKNGDHMDNRGNFEVVTRKVKEVESQFHEVECESIFLCSKVFS